MFRLLTSRLLSRNAQEIPAGLAQTAAAIADALPEIHLTKEEESTLLLTLGWISAAVGALALGLFVGRELRQRYKFNRRTPYDFYAHSGDEMQDMEFGVGI